jgi:glycosyltransferase involved in cell wall biosynthesis
MGRVRILLAHNSPYYPSFGGGDRSNRLLMAALAGRGHDVRVLARAAEFGPDVHARLAHDVEQRGIAVRSHAEELQFTLEGVDVRVFTRGTSLRAWSSARMQEWHPEAILTSTDDPAQVMLGAALQLETARVIYLIRAIIALPFGPASSLPNSRRSDVLHRTDGSVAVSEYVAQYARQWNGLDTVHVPISLPDRAIFPELGRYDNRYVTMVNPCAGKGLVIFLALVRHFSEVQFATVPTWGTTGADLACLRAHRNITILPPADDIDDILRQTRVAVVPSLWAEARSRIILEAMARAIPVLASNVGGMAEAMLGMDYVLPVNPVRHYRPAVDEVMVPVMDIPEQDPRPWVEALGHLLSDRAHYRDLSARSLAAALQYAHSVTVEPFEAYLKERVRAPRRFHPPVVTRPAAEHPAHSLSPHRRRLLVARLKQRTRTDKE